MMAEKDIDRLTSLLKDNSTALPHHSRVTERSTSKSPQRVNLTHNKSKNSRSDQSLSKGKPNNKSAVLINPPKEHSRIREEEMREALRKKKEHREKMNARNA